MEMDKQQQKLLIITGAPFLQAGNQSIRRTVSGLVSSGFQVEMWLLGVQRPLYYPNYPTNVVIKRFPNPFFIKYLKMLLGFLLRSLKHLTSFLLRNRSAPLRDRKLEEILDYRNDEVNQWLSALPASLYFLGRVAVHALIHRRTLKSVHGVWGYERGGVLAAKAVSKLLKSLFITSFQGTALRFYVQRYGIWKTFFKLPLDLLATWVKADLVIMTDDGTKGLDVLKQLGHSPERILLLPNGVDLKELTSIKPYAKSELGLKENELLFLVSTRLVPPKRVDRALVLTKALCDVGFQNFKLLIIGDGSDRSYLFSLIEQRGIKSKVAFCGAMPYHQSLNMIASADMIWSFQEGSNLTNTIQDALALGKHVLVLDDGSLNGFLEKSPGITAEQILAVPLDAFLEKAVEAIRGWYGNYSPSRKVEYKSKVWGWEDRIDVISERLSQLMEARQNE